MLVVAPYFWLGTEAENARYCECGDCDGYDHTLLDFED